MSNTAPAPPCEVRLPGAPALAVRVRAPEREGHEGRGAADRSGRPVVLLHDLGRTLEDWEPIAPLLAGRHPLYSVDLRGHGHSADGAWTLDGLLDDLVRVVGHFGLTAPVLVGHGLGGMLAVAYGTRSSRVTAVVNIEGHGWPRAHHIADRLGMTPEEAAGHTAAVRHYVIEQVTATLAPMPPDAFERMVAAYRCGVMGLPGAALAASALRSASTGDGVACPRPGQRAARELQTAFDFFDPDVLYPELRAPALTLVSTAPVVTPPGAPAHYAAIRAAQAEHELVPRGDHLPTRGVDAPYAVHMSHPGHVADLVEEFLAGR
ncbi:pimeloyl-ACP methyl ester carboxylesterase [Nocardiopsis mwathae]|uniref:Pimeloyl-ACP methyl ester carboxylesterase n=1 Tax=Nocardiopsis mwathae TaxID=1472723 RepID=A0A7W9YDR5_9ACTN|nr:alpha/beta hydrolase [Nocardiopsis mwathae]MBB6170100.1 pimeloyl-ACP methyl ester carboxylesterase [Nocardiopsis mwathae]